MPISKAAREERRRRKLRRVYGVIFGIVVIVIAGLGVAAIGELLAS